MAYGLPSQYGSDGNDLGDFVSEQAAGVRDDLTMTLRTMRDSLSTSLQTLNLTMAGIHNQLRNMASAFSPMARQAGGTFGLSNTYIPSYGISANLGSMSTPMASWLANNSFMGTAFGSKPYNVGGYEWALERQREMQSRITQFATDTGLGAASTGLSMYGANKIMNAIPFTRGLTGIGRFAASFPAFAAAGMVLEPFFDTMGEAAQAYGRDISQVQRMSARFGGQTWNRQQSAVAARGISNIAGNEIMNRTFYSTNLGIDGAREVLMQGLQNNMFQGSKPEELVKQMEKAAGVVKFLTGVLGSKDISETMQNVAMLKNMGINMFQHGDYATKLGMDAFKYGATMGVPGAQLLKQAMQIGGSAYMANGMPGFVGIQPAMQTMALASEMEKRRFLSPAQMAAAGGVEGLTQQTSQFNAAMMGHGAVGQMMFAAGMTGNGFSAGRVGNALGRGGYFGAMHQGLGNLAGDVRKYAKFMMNQDNYAADAAMQGNIEDQLDDMLFAAIDQFPIFMDDDTAAYQIKIMAQQNGVNLSNAAAKMKVMKHRKPNLMRALNNRANNERDKAFYAQNSLEHGVFRPYSRAGENVINTWDKFWHGVGDVGRWGVDVADRATGHVFGDIDNYQSGYRPDGIFNGKVMRGIEGLGDWGKGVSGLGKIDSKEFTRAYNNMRDDPYWFQRNISMEDIMDGKFVALGETGASRRYGSLLDGVNARNYAGYFKEAAQGNMSGGEAEAILRNAGIDYNIAYNGQLKWFNNSPTSFMEQLASTMGSDKAAALAGASTGANWYNNLSGSQANDIISSVGINTKGMSADALLQALVGAGGADDAVGRFASANGISRRQAAFGLTQKANIGSLSNLSMLHGASDTDFNNIMGASGALARLTGNTSGVDKLFAQSENGMNFSSSEITKGLGALGLTSDDLQSILATDDGAEQLKQFAYLLSQSADSPGSLTQQDYAGLTNSTLKSVLGKYSGSQNRSKLFDAINGSDLLSSTGTYKDISLNDRFMQLAGASVRQDGLSNIHKGLTDVYGIKLSREELDAKLSDGTLADYVMGLDGSKLNGEGRELQGNLTAIKNMTESEIRDRIKESGSTLGVDEFKKQLLYSQFTTDVANKGQEAGATKEKKTLVDEGMVQTTGGWAMRTVMTYDPIIVAKDKATTSSVSKAKDGGVMTFDPNWGNSLANEVNNYGKRN